MLQRMRDGIQGWITWVIIIAIIASLALLGISSYFHGGSSASQDIAAKVNDIIITQQQVTNAFNRLRQQQPELAAQAGKEQALRASILNNLIEQALLKQTALKSGFSVSQQTLDGMIAQIPAFQENGQFSQDRFLGLLAQMSYSPAQFMDEVRDSILVNQIQTGIANTSFVLPDDVLNLMQVIKQTRDFHYSIIPATQYLKNMTVTPAQVESYYEAHADEFKTPEKIQLQYLTVSASKIAANIKPTEAQLKQFYQNNLANYTVPASWRIAHIVINTQGQTPAAVQAKLAKVNDALKAGESFAEVAKKYSDDPLTAKQGGNLPWLAPTSLPTAIQDATLNLPVSQVSKPIQTSTGYEIVKVLAKKNVSVDAFESVQAKVREAYVSQQAQQQFTNLVQQLQDATFQNPDSLQPAATALHETIQSTDWISPNDKNIKGLFANPQLLQTAFSDTVRTGNNSAVLYPDPATAVVLRSKTYQAAQLIPLAQVSNTIHAALLQQASQQQAKSVGDKVVAELKDAKTLAQITTEYGLKWQQVKNVGRHDPKQKINVQVLQQAFNLPRNAADTVSAGSIQLANGDVAVIVVDAVNDVKLGKVLPAEQQIYQTQLQNYSGQFAIAELLQYTREHATIKTYQNAASDNTQ